MKIHYFDAPGRPEASRMLLAHAKQPFENVNYTRETFGELKASGKLEFGQVPALELPDGRLLVQSNAILRYLGRTLNYYPTEDAFTAWRIDSTLDSVEDFLTTYGKFSWESDPAIRAANKEKFLAWFPGWLAAIEKRLSSNSSQHHVVGDAQTIADFALFHVAVNIIFNEGNANYPDLAPLLAPFEGFRAYTNAQKEENKEYFERKAAAAKQ